MTPSKTNSRWLPRSSRRARDSGLTQQQVAERMKSTQGNGVRLENGSVMPSTRTLERFAEAAGHRLKITFEPVNRKSPR